MQKASFLQHLSAALCRQYMQSVTKERNAVSTLFTIRAWWSRAFYVSLFSNTIIHRRAGSQEI